MIEVTKCIVFYKPYAINQCRVFPQCLHIGHPLLKHRLYGILCMWTNIFYIICESILTNSHPWELSKPWRNTNLERQYIHIFPCLHSMIQSSLAHLRKDTFPTLACKKANATKHGKLWETEAFYNKCNKILPILEKSDDMLITFSIK